MPWRLVPAILPSYQFSSTRRIRVILSPWKHRILFSDLIHWINLYWITLLTNLSERHFHHCVSVEVEACDCLSVLQNLNRSTLLWLGFLCGGKELHKNINGYQFEWKGILIPCKTKQENLHTPPHSFEGKCRLSRDALLRTSSDRPAVWCTQCLPSETVTP